MEIPERKKPARTEKILRDIRTKGPRSSARLRIPLPFAGHDVRSAGSRAFRFGFPCRL